VAPGVSVLEFPVGHAYLWDWSGGLTIVDTGLDGSAKAILGARMLAHPADAPVMRGQQHGAPPQRTDLERPLAELLFGGGRYAATQQRSDASNRPDADSRPLARARSA
jgi:hypothetical protein